MDDIEKIKEQKKQELLEEQQQQQEDQQIDKQERQKEQILDQFLDENAKQRLNAVRMSDSERAEKVEQSIINLAQSGQINSKITGNEMANILSEINQSESQDYNIRGM